MKRHASIELKIAIIIILKRRGVEIDPCSRDQIKTSSNRLKWFKKVIVFVFIRRRLWRWMYCRERYYGKDRVYWLLELISFLSMERMTVLIHSILYHCFWNDYRDYYYLFVMENHMKLIEYSNRQLNNRNGDSYLIGEKEYTRLVLKVD